MARIQSLQASLNDFKILNKKMEKENVVLSGALEETRSCPQKKSRIRCLEGEVRSFEQTVDILESELADLLAQTHEDHMQIETEVLVLTEQIKQLTSETKTIYCFISSLYF